MPTTRISWGEEIAQFFVSFWVKNKWFLTYKNYRLIPLFFQLLSNPPKNMFLINNSFAPNFGAQTFKVELGAYKLFSLGGRCRLSSLCDKKLSVFFRAFFVFEQSFCCLTIERLVFVKFLGWLEGWSQEFLNFERISCCVVFEVMCVCLWMF